ncbi:MAG: GIY-YIG nuclease family protein [bacterium]|nr:GIY-YIG nuclease family protein [bacterium]
MVRREFYTYIMSNIRNSVLYVGMTGNLEGRVRQHKEKEINGFTKKYNITKLVYFEVYQTPMEAIYREKQIKRWRREKKVWLINLLNAEWLDLSVEWKRR